MSELSERLCTMEYKQRLRDKEQAERQKEIEKIQRKKEAEKERKEYEKDLLLACKRDLLYKFNEEFELQGLKAKYYFYNIENRKNIINSIATTLQESDYLEANYNKFLSQVVKNYELNEQYNEQRSKEIAEAEIEKMRPIWEEEARQKEEEAKKQERKQNAFIVLKIIWHIIKWIFIILFGGIFLIIKFIFDLAGA